MILDLLSFSLIIITFLCIVSIVYGSVKNEIDFVAGGMFFMFVTSLVGWVFLMNLTPAEKFTRPINVLVNTRPNFLTFDTDTKTLLTITDVPTYNKYANNTNVVTIYQQGYVNRYRTTNWGNYTITSNVE